MQTAKSSFNVKSKPANYIPESRQLVPLVRLSLTFWLQLVACPRRHIICDVISRDTDWLEAERECWLSAAQGLQPLIPQMADVWFIWGKAA